MKVKPHGQGSRESVQWISRVTALKMNNYFIVNATIMVPEEAL